MFKMKAWDACDDGFDTYQGRVHENVGVEGCADDCDEPASGDEQHMPQHSHHCAWPGSQ